MNKNIRAMLVVMCLFFLGPLFVNPLMAGDMNTSSDFFWIAPRSIHEDGDGTYQKKDFLKAIMDDRVWNGPGVKPMVFKAYIRLVGKVKVDGKVRDTFSDAELKELAAYLKKRRIRVAFEVGGVRVRGKYGPDDAGKYFREKEAPLLRARWIELGGEIHYLTTDHMTMAAAGTHHGGKTDISKFDLHRVLETCADTLQVMQKEFPGVAIGLTESLGYFDIKSESGVHYTKGRTDIPEFSFSEWIHPLVEQCRKRGVKIDHYHVDYCLSAMNRDHNIAFSDRQSLREYDIPKPRDLHLGRVLHCLHEAKKAGLKTGYLLTGGRHANKPLDQGSEEETWTIISTILESLAASGWKFDNLCLQSWQNFPVSTGLDEGPHSLMANVRKLAQSPGLSRMERKRLSQVDKKGHSQ